MGIRSRSSRNKPSSDLIPLFEYSNVVNSSVDLKFILSTVLLTVMGKMLVSRGMVLLRKEGHLFGVVAAKGVGEQIWRRTIGIQKLGKSMVSLHNVKKSLGEDYDFFLHYEMRLLVPILTRAGVVGVLGIGEKFSRKKFSASDRKLIKSLVNLSASAIEKAVIVDQLKVANRSLDTKYQELNTLFELSKEFNLVLDSQKVVRLLTFSLLGQIGVNRYAVCLFQSGFMRIVASKMEERAELHQAVQTLAAVQNPMLTEDLARRREFQDVAAHLARATVRAVIPMQVQNQTKGLMLLGEKLHGGSYTKGDLEFLYSLGNLAIISIENARLFQETLEKQRMQEELKIAREIQQGLLPQHLPEIEGFDLAAVNISSKEVGGDYYDVMDLPGKEFVLAIGDVSGKGTPAALLMANVQAALRALAPMEYTMPEATARMNDITYSNTRGDKFITLFWGILNAERRDLRYVNAGHNLPFLIRADKTVERLSDGGIILGMMKTVTPYEEGRTTLRPGDTMFLFTDGVSEAMNDHGEDFTEERLEGVLRKLAGFRASDIVREVQKEIEAYAGGTPQSDDMTMVVLRVL
ncbi:MAG: SpoIIE family protein phosphatase [Ignavibacteriales bacterium]|nr:SpoIIE family protein phosphatase [Ignavibacteriales bacterium]